MQIANICTYNSLSLANQIHIVLVVHTHTARNKTAESVFAHSHHHHHQRNRNAISIFAIQFRSICKFTKREKIPFSLLLNVHFKFCNGIVLWHEYTAAAFTQIPERLPVKNFKPNFPNVCIIPWPVKELFFPF